MAKYRIVEVKINGKPIYTIRRKYLFWWLDESFKKIIYTHDNYAHVLSDSVVFLSKEQAQHFLSVYLEKPIRYKNKKISRFYSDDNTYLWVNRTDSYWLRDNHYKYPYAYTLEDLKQRIDRENPTVETKVVVEYSPK